MEGNSTAPTAAEVFAGASWFDPIEAGLRERMRGFIETMLKEELSAALGRGRYRRGGAAAGGYRHGVRHRRLLGSFGPLECQWRSYSPRIGRLKIPHLVAAYLRAMRCGALPGRSPPSPRQFGGEQWWSGLENSS